MAGRVLCASSFSRQPFPKERNGPESQMRPLRLTGAGSEEPGSTLRARTGREMPCPLCPRRRQGQSLARDSRQHTQGDWLATRALRSLEGKPAAAQGEASQGAVGTGDARLQCGFKRRFTFSGLLGKSRVPCGPSLPLGEGGNLDDYRAGTRSAEEQVKGLGDSEAGVRHLCSVLQTQRNKQRKPEWELCSRRGLGQISGGTIWVAGL